MADGSPTRQQPLIFERYRLTLRQGPHHWTFAFAPQDAAAMVMRIRELACDPDAPLDGVHAEAVCRQIRRLPATTPATECDFENPGTRQPGGGGPSCR